MEKDELAGRIRALSESGKALAVSSDEMRRNALLGVAGYLEENAGYLFSENSRDMDKAREEGVSSALLHRLLLSPEKLGSAVKGLREIAALPDPLGRVREKRELDPGFVLEKVSFPIGVIGMVFEARPDALIQISGLCLRSGNAVVLKGGREAAFSNRALIKLIKEATKDIVGDGWILGIESHQDVAQLLSMDKYIDLMIPRGSNSFVRYIMDNTRIPVMGHADGICSVYVDDDADLDKAVRIATDSKVQYPAACNACETVLVAESAAGRFLPLLSESFSKHGVVVHADERSIRYFKGAIPATEDDYNTEFLSLECAIKVVSGIDEAISHIAEHSSKHTDAIVTENQEKKRKFFLSVDSADVFCNCSTRFADGYRFGLGAEVGISTSKLHARGPVGLDGLTTTKWLLSGNGETVAEYSGPNGKPFHHKELI
ncbi:MAG: glutamate-5-semialdehyde dehydrogenase [Candidatus Ornithospirochaeta sp.]|nr:glutamate-5-semialdehyde dehydrogenase [Candidatus Ornithospirochaeta sp.]